MAAAHRGFWLTLRAYGQVVGQKVLAEHADVTLGEAADCDLVLPGLGERVRWRSRGRIKAVPGLDVRASGAGLQAVVAAHPHITLELRKESGAPAAGLDWRAHLPWREALYGVSLLGLCWAALAGRPQPVTVIGILGEPAPADSAIARFVYSGPGHVAPAKAPLAAAVEPEEEDEASEPQVDAQPEPVLAQIVEDAPPKRSRPRKARKVATERSALISVLSSTKSAGVLDTVSDVDLGQLVAVNGIVAGGGPNSHSALGELLEVGDGGLAADVVATCKVRELPPKENVDVVFVLDVSTTMGFVIGKLADEMDAVDAQVRKHDQNPHYGLVVFVDDVRVAGGGQAYTSVSALKADFRRFADFAASNQQLGGMGSNGDWPENSLDALHAAATRFDWRDQDETARIIVHATDDSFGDRGAVQSGVEVQHSYRQTVHRLKEEGIRVASFAARIGGSCECEDVRPGFLAPHEGRKSIPRATGGAGFDIDAVASGRLRFASAIGPMVRNTVCDE